MLHKNMQEARTKAGLTKAEVARKLNIPYTTYNGYEIGKRNPDPELLPQIASALGTDVNYLLTGQIQEESIQQYRDGAAERHRDWKRKVQTTREYYKSLGYSIDYRGDDYIITEPDGTQITMDAMREMPLYEEMVSNTLAEDAELIHQRAVKKIKQTR